MKDSTITSKIIYTGTGIALIFVLWVIISAVNANEFVYPRLSTIFVAIGQIFSNKEILLAGLFSLLRVGLVLLASLIVSFVYSFIYICFKNSIFIIKPLLTLFKASPLAIISVYLWISLGGEIAPYLITLLMTLPLCLEGFITAIDNIDQPYILEMKTEQVSIINKYFKVYIPLIAPYILMTVLQTFGLGIKVMLMGEYICQTSNSLGVQIYYFKQNLQFDYLLGLLVIIVAIVLLIELGIKLISSKISNK